MPDVRKAPSAATPAEPRLLRFLVDGRPCYAMKWRDERTENRREVDYVIREAGEDVVVCLLADCPLRIAGTPDLVSVVFTGQSITRAETRWDRAATTWEGGEVDDEGLVRVCSPDCFPDRAQYLRQDLTRMIREYRQGTRGCHSTRSIAAAPASDGALRREVLAPMVLVMQAFEKRLLQAFDDKAPQCAADRIKAVVAYIKKTVGVSEIERKAAILAMEQYSYAEIADRLPHKAGKPVTREAVRQALVRFERKAKLPGMFSKGSYRQQVKIDAERGPANAIDAQDGEEEFET